MGRRRAGAASPEDTSAPAETPVGRRSSRLAVKDRVDYNEVRIFKKILADAPKAEAKKPKKSAEPRKTARSKDKLSKGGSVAVRITNETSTYPISTTSTRTTRTTAKSSGNATSSRSGHPSFSSITVASSSVQQSIGVSPTTPVSSRKHARKQPVRSRLESILATVEEDVPLTMSSSSSPRSVGQLKRALAPATITPDTTLMAIDQESLRRPPTKRNSRKERSESPTDRPVGRRVQPRATTLFRDEDEEEGAAAAARAADDTMREAMNDPLLADVGWPEAAVVPEKKRKESTVAEKGRITVSQQADTKKTVIKTGQSLQDPTTKKKNRVSAAQAQNKSGRGGSVVSFFMERTVKSEDVGRSSRDDAFANQINEGSGELDRSMSIAAGIESGTLGLEDLAPDDRWIRELFSPVSTAGTPRLDRSLAMGSPLILPVSSADRSGGSKKQRTAGMRARKNLSHLFESESDADSTISSPSERREMTSFVSEPTFDPNRAQKYMRNKDVRAMFRAATNNAANQAAARVAEMTPATRKAMQKSIQRKKIQYPGIAPLPEDLVEDTVAHAALPDLMNLVL